uniref:CUB domain-containing protein n=2 Tax=Arion vulgaris TaxID=1028688 RepID=A0A0B7B120_9EUPU
MMTKFDLLLIVLVVFLSRYETMADEDDDDCKRIKSLIANSETSQLTYSTNSINYSREYCVYWKVAAPRYEVIEVTVPVVNSLPNANCEGNYLRLLDDDSDLTADYRRKSQSSKFITKGSKLMIYFRPGYCLTDFTLTYKSLPRLVLTGKDSYHNDDDDDDSDDDDNRHDKGKGNNTGAIVGAVIGSILALLLIALMFFLIQIYVKRTRARNTVSREDNVTVHFWSKPSGYTPAVETTATSLRGFEPQSGMTHKKPYSVNMEDAGVYTENRATTSAIYATSPPAPPPYFGPITNSRTELFHHNDELPPAYADAVQSK